RGIGRVGVVRGHADAAEADHEIDADEARRPEVDGRLLGSRLLRARLALGHELALLFFASHAPLALLRRRHLGGRRLLRRLRLRCLPLTRVATKAPTDGPEP